MKKYISEIAGMPAILMLPAIRSMKITLSTFGKWLAILSFLIGTGFMATYYFNDSGELIFYGYFFVIAAVIVNLMVFIILLIKSTLNNSNRSKLLRTAGIMALNIPVALAYFYFVLVLVNTMRITFINETGGTLTNIFVDGCETIELGEIHPNEQKTCWIDINRDCTITLDYSLNGQTESEVVFGYVTSSMGQKGTYRIGTNSKPIDETF
ncbi:hypothetical protein [Fulvivirga lutimaris]|uniref:hypothetical protein n=1 Tax=Fulvivirga lutimaris TaxID=1819566 RepID=UPI0012BCA0C5|nr:hypothetical protein [Fulvivirga lutimaris]MTI38932.1 hypothetical protein [Fulvivirga lutimaris]